MVFDINRRTLIDKNKELFQPVSHKPSKSFTKSEVPVYERLIDDINRRNSVKQRLEEYAKAQEEAKSESVSKTLNKTESSAVFNRLLGDVDRRFETKKAAELFKEMEAEQEVLSFSSVTKHMSKGETQLMVARLNGNTYTGEAEYRQHKLDAARLEKKQRLLDEAARLANLHHPKRALDPKVQERLTQEQKIIAESYGVQERPNSSIRGTKSEEQVTEKSPKKMFSIQDSIKSGERLMNARTYRSRRYVEPEPVKEPKRLNVKKEFVSAQNYRGRSPDFSPSHLSEPSTVGVEFPHRINILSSEASSPWASPNVSSLEYKRQPIQLRGRPGDMQRELGKTQTSLMERQAEEQSVPSKSFVSEFQKAGRYNHSKAVAGLKQRTDRESPERRIPQPTSDWQSSPTRSPTRARSPVRTKIAAETYETLLRPSCPVTPQAYECSDRSYQATPIRGYSPTSSKVQPSPRLVAREALNLPSEDLKQRLGLTGEARKTVLSSQRESVETRSESISDAELRASLARHQRPRQDVYSSAESASPYKRPDLKVPSKAVQSSQPSKRPTPYTQEAQVTSQARLNRMNSSPGKLYRQQL
jgi:hypothetical protein